MKKINIFIIFVCLIYTYYTLLCGPDNCITDGLSCQSSGVNICDPQCRPKYGDTSTCYDCSDISASGFYTITDLSCTSPGDICTNGYIIEYSKECMSDQPINTMNLFHIGKVYYKECPDYTIKISSNECKCAYKFYIDETGLYHCLSPTEKCLSSFYY